MHDADDAGVVDARERLDLLAELAADPVGDVLVAELFEEHLDDDALVHQLRVAREVDDPEPALAELALDTVAPVEQLPGQIPGAASPPLFLLAHYWSALVRTD